MPKFNATFTIKTSFEATDAAEAQIVAQNLAAEGDLDTVSAVIVVTEAEAANQDEAKTADQAAA